MTVYDTAHTKVALVQKHILTAFHKEYQIYGYHPNCPTQTSTETDDGGVPVYRWARVQKALGTMTSEFYYNLYECNDLPNPSVLLAKVQFSWAGLTSLKMDIKPPGSGQDIVGTVGKSSMFHLRGNVNWVIELARGMDALGMLCLTLAANKMIEEEEEANHNNRQ